MSKSNKTAIWMKNGEVIAPSDRFEMRVEGTKHFLTIRDSTLDDDAKYTVRIETAECSAQLTVEGKRLSQLYTVLYDMEFRQDPVWIIG